jgi:hypothetical protein
MQLVLLGQGGYEMQHVAVEKEASGAEMRTVVWCRFEPDGLLLWRILQQCKPAAGLVAGGMRCHLLLLLKCFLSQTTPCCSKRRA